MSEYYNYTDEQIEELKKANPQLANLSIEEIREMLTNKTTNITMTKGQLVETVEDIITKKSKSDWKTKKMQKLIEKVKNKARELDVENIPEDFESEEEFDKYSIKIMGLEHDFKAKPPAGSVPLSPQQTNGKSSSDLEFESEKELVEFLYAQSEIGKETDRSKEANAILNQLWENYLKAQAEGKISQKIEFEMEEPLKDTLHRRFKLRKKLAKEENEVE